VYLLVGAEAGAVPEVVFLVSTEAAAVPEDVSACRYISLCGTRTFVCL
jgi:hypothetical protein